MELIAIIVLLAAIFIMLVWCFYALHKTRDEIEKAGLDCEFAIRKVYDVILDMKILNDFREEVRKSREPDEEFENEIAEESEAARKAEKAFTDGVSSILNYDVDKVRSK